MDANCDWEPPFKAVAFVVKDANGRHLLEVTSGQPARDADEDRYLDERDLVRAIDVARIMNSHDALVEALQELVADYEDATGGSFPDGHPEMLSVVAKARAALAKAEAAS